MEKRETYNIKAVENALDVLESFMELGTEISSADYQRHSGVSSNTSFRVLTTMANKGYLIYNDQTERYRLSLKILQLCNLVVNSLEVRRVAMPFMTAFWEQHTMVNMNLAVLEGQNVFSICRLNSVNAMRYSFNPGTKVPPHASAVGKALLCELPEAEVLSILAYNGMTPYTARTLLDPVQYCAELTQVRKDGASWCHGEYIERNVGVAVPIRNQAGKITAGLSISYLEPDFSTENPNSPLVAELLPGLKKTAYSISYALGYSGVEYVE